MSRNLTKGNKPITGKGEEIQSESNEREKENGSNSISNRLPDIRSSLQRDAAAAYTHPEVRQTVHAALVQACPQGSLFQSTSRQHLWWRQCLTVSLGKRGFGEKRAGAAGLALNIRVGSWWTSAPSHGNVRCEWHPLFVTVPVGGRTQDRQWLPHGAPPPSLLPHTGDGLWQQGLGQGTPCPTSGSWTSSGLSRRLGGILPRSVSLTGREGVSSNYTGH